MSESQGTQPPPPPPAPQQPIAPSPMSGDGKYFWDGQQWVPTVSPDGKFRWTGTAWVPHRKMFLGDYANQSIASAIIGIFCGPFFLFGFYAGYKAYQELPHKRTQAIVGIVLNACGVVLWIVSLFVRFAVLPNIR